MKDNKAREIILAGLLLGNSGAGRTAPMPSPSEIIRVPDSTREAAMNKRQRERFVNRQLKKGLSPFYFFGTEVWALNEKNANRKARKRGLI